MRRYLLLILMIVFNACASEKAPIGKLQSEMEQLNSIEKQTAFLVQIWERDQGVRDQNIKAQQEFGFESAEHKASMVEMRKTDSENLEKIEAYLSKYGYPTKSQHGEEACGAPWTVLHHASTLETRQRNFKHLYKAFKKGDIDADGLAFFLNRMHQMKLGRRIKWDRPYKVEEELDTLFRALELLPVIKEME